MTWFDRFRYAHPILMASGAYLLGFVVGYGGFELVKAVFFS